MTLAYPSMNTGWHAERPDNAFMTPMLNARVELWHGEVDRWFKRLFSFHWVGRLEEQVYYRATPFLVRSAGIAELGGVYDFALLDFMLGREQVQRQALALAPFESPLRAGLNAFHVRVHSGQFYEDELHWLELHNPYTFQREWLSLDELYDLTVPLGDDVTAAFEASPLPAWQAPASNPMRRAPEGSRVSSDELMSSGLLLAELFSAKRIPFRTIVHLRAALPNYAATYRCLAELPAEGASELDWRRLVTLYG